MAELIRKLQSAWKNPGLVPRILWRLVQARSGRHFTGLLKGWSFPPETVNIYPTTACNLNCAMCFIRFSGVGPGLDFGSWTKLVDQLKTFLPRIHLSGGEPLLYPQIDGLIAHIKSAGMFLHVTTNGTLLADHAAELVRQGVNQIKISIDGPRETHDRLRGVPGTFDRAMTGLDTLQRHRGRSPSPKVKINSILNFEKPGTMGELLKAVAGLGVAEVQFIHPLFLSTAGIAQHRRYLRAAIDRDVDCWLHADQYRVEPLNLNEIVEITAYLKRNTDIRVTVFPDFDAAQAEAYYHDRRDLISLVKPQCAAMWNTATILANGDLESCPDYVVGNCLTKPFPELWNAEPMRALRRRIRDGEYFSVCRACCFFYQ